MISKKYYLFLLCSFLSLICLGQNLLENTTSIGSLNAPMWTLGSGSISGFSQNGSTSENWRIQGVDHVGQETILWEARNDASYGPDGGWNSSYKAINNTQTYRFSVWIKKTNSNDGRTYFGCRRSNGILRLNGSVNNNPYFWSGDLPQLDRWYLLVGYVHKKTYNSQTNLGAIYDGVTGEQVTNINVRDYKFSSSATSVSHRAYLYYDPNTDDRQYFMKPRLEKVNGLEPSINELLNINENSAISFGYDVSGNQAYRSYCSVGTNCRNSIREIIEPKNSLSEQSLPTIEILKEGPLLDINDGLLPDINVYPNPTEGKLTVTLNGLPNLDGDLSIYDVSGKRIYNVNAISSKNLINISKVPSGVYIMHIHFLDGNFITKRIIKN